MQCSKCNVKKLSKEFYRDALTDTCEHASFYCAKCLLNSLKLKPECPTCKNFVNASIIAKVEEFKKSFEVTQVTPTTDNNANDNSTGTIHISLLDGQSFEFPHNTSTTIVSLKLQLQQKINVEPGKLQLSYQQQQLKNNNEQGVSYTLGMLNIPSGATLQLIVLMLAIPEGSDLDNIVFDLHWGYPNPAVPDYLDGTCILWGNSGFLDLADFQHMKLEAGVSHSGDVHGQGSCHHKITVPLKKLPAKVTQLYFVLSAWNSPTIAAYKSPSVSLYDTRRPTQQLTSYSIQNARNSQAVVMCRLCRRSGGWNVETVGKMSTGNAKDYIPITATIRTLSQQ